MAGPPAREAVADGEQRGTRPTAAQIRPAYPVSHPRRADKTLSRSFDHLISRQQETVAHTDTDSTVMQTRLSYFCIEEARPGMVLGALLTVVTDGVLRFSLPSGHVLTEDNLFQLAAHHAEVIYVQEPDPRSAEEVEAEAAMATARVNSIFAGADLANPVTAALFAQVLRFRTA
ncbi:MAG TPA: hypothetical protein VIK97_20070, partial [Casimicrobiaceae bacterium]